MDIEDFTDLLKTLLAILPALLIIGIPLILRTRALRRRKAEQLIKQEQGETKEAKEAKDNKVFTQTAEIQPLPIMGPEREYSGSKSDSLLQSVEAGEVISPETRKGVREKLESLPPLKRAIVWAEILGRPRGLS